MNSLDGWTRLENPQKKKTYFVETVFNFGFIYPSGRFLSCDPSGIGMDVRALRKPFFCCDVVVVCVAFVRLFVRMDGAIE